MRLHFIGIGGRAMGGIAMALARAGHEVTGSDEDVYDPMSSCLARAGIRPTPFRPEHVPADTDAIIVGKRITDDNRELEWARQHGRSCRSFPAFLQEHFLSRSRNVVVAGGVGKTTTTALTTWILDQAGRRPDYMIGGVARNLEWPARFDRTGLTVLEGDEYASGAGDGSPKFLHYAPEVVAMTNLLADHPDLYPDRQSLVRAFAALVALVPAHGRLILSTEDEASQALTASAACEVTTVGTDLNADRVVADVTLLPQGSFFSLDDVRFFLPMHGLMNVRNAAMALVTAAQFGVPLAEAVPAVAAFKGLVDRQDAIEAGDCIVVRDKASHPESLQHLCAALRQRYPGRRLVSVMQPRATGGRRWIYQRDLPAALAAFDAVVLTNPYEHKPPSEAAWKDDPFCLDALAGALCTLGAEVQIVTALADLPEAIRRSTGPGDVVLLSLREQFASWIDLVEEALAGRAAPARPRKI